MTRDTNTFSRRTVAVVVVLLVAAGMTAGAVLAAPATADDPSAVTGADQVQQVEENETTTEEPADDETTEEPADDETTEEPADDETTEEPADDETTEEPADDETTEEPADDETTEEPALTRAGDYITYTTPAGEAYGVENLTISEAEDDEMIEVTAEVTNPNDWLAVQSVEFRADGDVVERTHVALEGHETDHVSFTLDTSEWEDDDHTVAILSHDYGEVMSLAEEEPVEELEANVTFEDQTSNGTTVVVDEVHLSDGGFVAIHESASLAEGDAVGSVIGVSEYLTPGTHENVTVTLFDVPGADFDGTSLDADTDLTAMPHVDSNDNMAFEFVSEEGAEDGPYTEDGEAVVDDASVTIEEDAEPTASVTFDDQTSNGTAVVVDEANLSDGGFVVIHESASLAEGDALGSTIGVSEYLSPGTHENVTVTLFDVPGQDFTETELEDDTNLTAMPHLDTNDNSEFDFVSEEGAEDGPYTEDGEAVVDDAMVTVEADEPAPTTEEPTNETTTEEPTNETTTEEPTNETTTEEPTNETTTEEPTNETTTEEPTDETTTEEATDETTTEDDAGAETTTEAEA
ncbi:S-layer-forming halobacterial major cell surfaceglycoprotein [Halanaeroarchaeum sp. HSR-CO]|uniref:DUF7282 domain-containing protein n=1 Tax=Halanaeroarchaeum sp. HSR-CO TaxID=2866382 RepID=UPI00217DF95A|nr:hypothetical protein [Halanaeroarchaeum sp. HSR-CO]UWG47957.1 S-layer-forming halobacterial major cell surfaceglycoprotein [Halanaeroarchaeum sp. HSR-CO]